MKEHGFAKVIIDLPSREIDRPFEYSVPSKISSLVDVGSTVLVQFGHLVQIGYVIELISESEVSSHNPILEVLDHEPVFNSKMVQLCQWISNYYSSTLSQALALALPPGRRRHLSQFVKLTVSADQARDRISTSANRQREVIECIENNGGKLSVSELRKTLGKSISSTVKVLEEKEIVGRKHEISEPKVSIKKEEYIRLTCSPEKARSLAGQMTSKAPRQSAILNVLVDQPQISACELLNVTGSSRESLKTLIGKGVISNYFNSTYREPDFYYPEIVPRQITLTEEQNRAIQEIQADLNKNQHKTFLLQGITGSGKTEVYIQVIRKILDAGKTAIVLVPEIALTPQTAHRFRSIFGEIVAVLHSGLGAGERFDQWRRVRKGLHGVVVGARSALFAPLENLGVIVVDEEHESTYKQNRNPRYHAVEVALKRAEIEQCPVILGSATPAVESRYRAECGDYTHLTLTSRVEGRKLPQMHIVDLKEELKNGNRSIFSLVLQSEMQKCIDAENKFILFLNRRGYASFILCRDCGFVPKCKRCAVSFTYHRDKSRLLCHHCNSTTLVPQTCPNCGSSRIRDFGVGTQKVEGELRKLFPDLNIVRMDADTTRGRDTHRKKLIEFQSRPNSVLLGTQMIAKGLDFPEVTLVGVINGDTALNLPDFRAAERTFQLLMQVSGRAGRGKQPGKVVLQTYLPENYAISALSSGEYDSFYKQEVALRRELDYPPFCCLINIQVSSKDNAKAERAAQRISRLISQADHRSILSILGPATAPFFRIKGRFRWHIVLKVSDAALISEFLREQFCQINWLRSEYDVRLIVDVDPVWML